MRRAFIAVVTSMLATVLGTTAASAADCAYRPDTSILNDADTSLTYANVGQSGFKYRASLLNDREYYLDLPSQCPSDPSMLCIMRGNVMTQYLLQTHAPLASEMVVLIHGNSAQPEDWFDWLDRYYTHTAGYVVWGQGFDVYAPYVTHNSRFQEARRRMASIKDERFNDLDVRRVVNLIEEVGPQYQKIHIAGASQGGMLSVLVYRELQRRQSPLVAKVGAVLSIEGFVSERRMIAQGETNALFAWNWGMNFDGTSDQEFLAAANDPRVWLAYGTCGAQRWAPVMADVPTQRLLTYDGPHEFRVDVLLRAMGRVLPIRLPDCTPRPAVVVHAEADGPGRLRVLVTAPTPIQSITFDQVVNASVPIPTLTGNVATFVVERRTPTPMQAPFTVVDACGPWPSFVGSGG